MDDIRITMGESYKTSFQKRLVIREFGQFHNAIKGEFGQFHNAIKVDIVVLYVEGFCKCIIFKNVEIFIYYFFQIKKYL